jgi:hypothetical protein
MTRSSLNAAQLRTMVIIETLGFGVIARLSINNGSPHYVPEPCITQEIKLAADPAPQPHGDCPDLTLKKEFERLFDQLSQLRSGIVDIEVRHSAPFKLVVERRFEELLF